MEKSPNDIDFSIEDTVEYEWLKETHWMLSTMEYHNSAAQVARRLEEIESKYKRGNK